MNVTDADIAFWRERFRKRLQPQAESAEMDPEVAELIAISAARPRPKLKSYLHTRDWQQAAKQGGSRRSERLAEVRAQILAAGEKTCRCCGTTQPLSEYGVRRRLGIETLNVVCRSCDAAQQRERYAQRKAVRT